MTEFMRKVEFDQRMLESALQLNICEDRSVKTE